MKKKIQTTRGVSHCVPCPYCGEPNDFRELLRLNELASSTMRPGDKAACDHCDQDMRIHSIQHMTVIKLQTLEEV